MAHRALGIAGLTLLMATSGCVMAARHAAKEINRESAEAKIRTALPIGSPKARIATVMDERGYGCADVATTEPGGFIIKCLIRVRSASAGTVLVGGNWSYEFTGKDGLLLKVHASGKRAKAG